MIPRNHPFFGFSDIPQISSVLFRDDISGLCIDIIKRISGFKYVILFPFARSAIRTVLSALSIKDKEVILPAYTCKVVPMAILQSHNIPKFMDIAIKDFNINLSSLSGLVSINTGAVIPTLMYGNPCVDLPALSPMDKKVLVIEDASMAFGNKNLVSLKHPFSCAVFSFNIGKITCCLEGGILATNNPEIYEKTLKYIKNRFSAQSKWYTSLLLLKYLTILFFYKEHLYNFICLLRKDSFLSRKISLDTQYDIDPGTFEYRTLSNFQLSLLINQVLKIDKEKQRRQPLFSYLDSELSEISGIICPGKVKGSSHSHYTIIVENINRDYFCQKLLESGIEPIPAYNYCLPYLAEFSRFNDSLEYPNASYAAKRNVCLPFYYLLTERQAKKIVYTIKRIVYNYKEDV